MPSVGFYDENLGRSYPFLHNTLGRDDIASSFLESLSNELIVDFGCTVEPGSGFIDGTHKIYLYSVERADGEVTFEFRSNAPGLIGRSLIFTRETTSTDYEIEYATADMDEVSEPCQNNIIWRAYLVTGTMSSLTTDGTWVAATSEDYVQVEPAQIENQSQAYVRAIHLANGDRTRAETAGSCIDYEWPFELADIYVNKRCLENTISIIEGYNCDISIENNNTITISAGVGAGAGEPCEEVRLFDSETPADGETSLSGGPKCDEVLRSINGIGGRSIAFTAGTGAQITTFPDSSLIVIDLNMKGLSTCSDIPSEDLECPPEEDDDYCGSE